MITDTPQDHRRNAPPIKIGDAGGTIALTGATGFVGRHALARLLADGWRVNALARSAERMRRALADLPPDARERVHVVDGDLADDDALRRLLEGADAAMHVAGVVKAPDERTFLAANARAAARLAGLAREWGVPRFVHVSSLAAREPHLSTYARSKREGEEAVMAELGDAAVAVRPPAVYGPGDEATFGLIDQLTRSRGLVPGRKDMRVSLIHVRDLADALALLARTRAGGGEVLEMDDGREGGYAWAEMAEEASRVLDRRVRLHLLPRPLVATAAHAADALARLTGRSFMLSREKVNELYHHDWVARSPKVQERLDWTPALQFADGLLDTLCYWCDRGRLPPSRLPARLRKHPHKGRAAK